VLHINRNLQLSLKLTFKVQYHIMSSMTKFYTVLGLTLVFPIFNSYNMLITRSL